MEIIISLILLGILGVTAFFFVGRRILHRGYLDDNALYDKPGKQNDAYDCGKDEQWEHGPVYDGMITVEIPITDDRGHASEPVLDAPAENIVEGPALHVSHR